MQPIAKPSREPTASTIGSASSGDQPLVSISEALISVESATTEPTERSIPPVRITNVIPTATTSRNALSIRTLRITWPEAKPS